MAEVFTDLTRAASLIARNLHSLHTVRRGPYSWTLDLSGRCYAPAFRQLRGVGDPVLARDRGPHGVKQFFIDMHVRCRSCGWCLRQRSRAWESRASTETTRATRTWFITLTLSPANHYLMLAQARAAGRNDPSREFADRCWAIGKEITRYLKRIRKESGAKLRYVLVAEPHKSGLPHFHMLVHEQGGKVAWKTLTTQWKLGHSKAKLCDAGSARYVAKYLSKDARARVRASVHYGALLDVDELPEITVSHPSLIAAVPRIDLAGTLEQFQLHSQQDVSNDLHTSPLVFPGGWIRTMGDGDYG